MTMKILGQGVWHDLDGTGYIGLDLTVIPTPEKQVIEGTELYPKDEYHCSLVNVRHYIGDDEPSEEQRIGKAVEEYLRHSNLRFTGLGEERYLCRREDRTTLVAPVQIDGFDEFASLIETLIPGYRPPFLHVTLLKSEATRYGISINSEGDLLEYCERLTPSAF